MSNQHRYLEKDFGAALRWSEQCGGGAATTNRAISSFTPINHNLASATFINPVENIRNGSINSNTLYGIPEDNPIDYAPSRREKRSPSKLDNGTLVSLGKAWEYNDGDNSVLQIVGGRTVKRRKPITAGRTKSMGLTKSSIQGIGTSTDELDKQEAFQLNSLPETEKMLRRRSAPVKETKFDPFKNPAITNQILVSPKEKQVEVVTSKPTSSYQGFTTTEEVVRLSKTTLDKLAAFRFKSSTGQIHKTPVLLKIPPPEQSEESLSSKQSEISRLSSRYGLDTQGLLPENGHLFERHNVAGSHALRDGDTTIDQVDQTHCDASKEAFQEGFNAINQRKEKYDITNLSRPRRGRHRDNSPGIALGMRSTREDLSKNSLDQEISTIQLQSQISSQQLWSLHSVFEYDDPTSSELMIMNGLMEKTDVIPLISQHGGERDRMLPTLKYSVVPKSLENAACDDSETSYDEGFRAATEAMSDSQIEMEAFEEISLPDESLKDAGWLPITVPTHLVVQVKRSNIGDDEESHNISKHYEYDEFDEGLDDSDFLITSSTSVVPQTPLNHLIIDDQDRNGRSPRGMAATFQPENPSSSANNIKQNKLDHSGAIAQPRVITADIDDEYPIDKDFEREMCNIPELFGRSTPKDMAPESLQSIPQESSFNDMFDGQLQCSPKSMTPSFSFIKPLSDRRTSKPIAFKLIENGRDAQLDHLENDEEWNLIHLNRDTRSDEGRSSTSDLNHQKVSDVNLGVQQCPPRILSIHNPYSETGLQRSGNQPASILRRVFLDDSHEYKPLSPFARPNFPNLTLDRSPIIGLSPGPFLRVCFRIGEMIKEGARCNSLKRDAVVELFARVIASSRESGTTKQHFQFADMWHDRPPFPNGVLANYKSSDLAESESRALINCDESLMVRCLGRLRRDSKAGNAWILDVINIRRTDWEEIRWTKRIVSAGVEWLTP